MRQFVFSFKITIQIIFFFLCCVTSNAQKKEVFKFQKDDSLLKVIYLKQAESMHNTFVASFKSSPNYKDYKEIFSNRTEIVHELLTSSRSVTDSVAHNYLQRVLQKITQVNPELKDLTLRVFFSRDWWPNAFSLGDGTIVINAGLFMYMENEAQLAFTLSHELAHFYLDHGNIAIKKYVETINSKEFQDKLKKISKEEFRVNEKVDELTKAIVFNSRRHSREKETEADKQGLLFLKKSGYNTIAAKTCLQMLGKIDDSLIYKPLNLEQVFSFPNFYFNPRWIKFETTIFGKLGKNDGGITKAEKDSLKTHPDCEKRIALIQDSIYLNNSNGNSFQIDSTLFANLKRQFFAEIVEENYKQKNLSRNLYYSLLQLQANDNRPFAIYSVQRNLLLMYDFQKKHTLGKTIDVENKHLKDDYNLLLRMLSRISLSELAELCKAFYDTHNTEMNDYNGWDELSLTIKKINL